MSTFSTEQKLEESHNIKPPLDIDDQMGLLFAYRRALAHILVLEGDIKRLMEHNKELDLMLQDWIIRNPRLNRDYRKLMKKEKRED